MTSIGMTSHFITSCYGVHFCIECVNRPVPKTCKVSIGYVSWFTRYATTLIIFRMTLVFMDYKSSLLEWFIHSISDPHHTRKKLSIIFSSNKEV